MVESKYVVRFYDSVDDEWVNVSDSLDYEGAMEVLREKMAAIQDGGLMSDHYDLFKVV